MLGLGLPQYTPTCAREVGHVLARVGGGAHGRGHERGPGDDEAEREEAGADHEWAGADRVVEDEDSAEIAERLAATEVMAMTSTPSPIWRLRAEA